MKSFFKTATAIVVGMALVLGFQYIPLQEILPAKAQTVRMLGGPTNNPFSATYLTPVSNTLNTNLPQYAIYETNLTSNSSLLYAPQTMDVNADGLMDFVYASFYDGGPTYRTSRQAVVLNTGNGFNLVYICDYGLSGSTHTYKGDCAAN